MADQVERFDSGRGQAETQVLKPDVIYLKVTGHLDKATGAFALGNVQKMAAAARGGRITVFCDWADMSGYDSEVRATFTQWVASNRTTVKFHLLVASKIVSMGVSVANLALDGVLIGYTNRTAFDAAMRTIKMGLGGVR